MAENERPAPGPPVASAVCEGGGFVEQSLRISPDRLWLAEVRTPQEEKLFWSVTNRLSRTAGELGAGIGVCREPGPEGAMVRRYFTTCERFQRIWLRAWAAASS